MASQDELVVRIGADFSELKSQLKKAGDETDKFGKKTKETSKLIDTSFASVKTAALGVVGAITAAAVAVGSLTKQVMDNAKEQRLWSRRLGVSAENFASLAAIAKRFGAETDDVGDAMKDLNERIADASAGGKAYEEALNRMGIKSKELINLPVEEQFIKVADAISKMNNVGDANWSIADLMGDAGFRLFEVFRLGEPAIRKLADEVQRTNEAMSAFELKQLEDAGKASKELNAAFTGFSNTLTQAALPAIREMTRLLKDAADFYGKLFSSSADEIKEDIDEINERLSTLGDPGARPTGRGRATSKWLEQNKEINDLLNERSQLIKNLAAVEKTSVSYGGISATTENEDEPLSIGETSDEKREEVKLKRTEDLNSMIEDALNADMTLLDIKTRGEQELTKIQEDNAKARMKITAMENAAKLNAVKGVFGNLSTLMNTENRKLFEIGKASAIAQATISTYEAATTSFAQGSRIGGPPLGFAFAATAVAAGLANVANIASTSMGGGGGGGAGAGGGASVSAPPQAAPENVVDATFNLSTQQGFVSTDQIRGVAAGLNEYIEDGGRIRSVSVL